MIKEMGKEKNIIMKEMFFMKENLKIIYGREKEKNILRMVKLYLKENIQMDKNGMEKGIFIMKKVNQILKKNI